MGRSAHLFDLLVAAAPNLRAWRELANDYSDVPSVHYAMLADELMGQAQNGAIPVLPSIAPLIETLLKEWDENDAVSIGFIEKLQALVEERGLDSKRVYAALGPIARSHWESLYHFRHQLHLCEIDFDERHIAGPLRTPARLEQWLVKPGSHVIERTPLARLSATDRTWELAVRFGCYVDRFAALAGQALKEGELLLYVLPDVDAHRRPPLPYCTFGPNCYGPGAAA